MNPFTSRKPLYLIGLLVHMGYFPLLAQPHLSHLLSQKADIVQHPHAHILHPDLLWLAHSQKHGLSDKPDRLEIILPSTTYYLADDQVRIEAYARQEGKHLLAQLKQIGLSDGTYHAHHVNGWLPISSLASAHQLDELLYLAPVGKAYTRSGSVTSEGDNAIEAANARALFGIDGTGVKVGVISDSYDALGGAAAGVTSGDLPAAGVQVLLDNTGAGVTDEGRAMCEVIHDVAPGAELAFYTGLGGQASLANAILALEAAGCDIIVEDLTYSNSPFYQDGIVAQTVDAVHARGIIYLSAAGNDGIEAYEDAFTGDGTPGNINGNGYLEKHFFGPGDDRLNFTVPIGATVDIMLQWAEAAASVNPASAPTVDLNLFLEDATNGTMLDFTILPNAGVGNDPREFIEFTNTTAGTSFNLMVVKGLFSGPNAPDIRIIFSSDQTGISLNEYRRDGGTLFGQAMAEGAIAVGASDWTATPFAGATPPQLNLSSSAAGTSIQFDGNGNAIAPVTRSKPDIVAVDGISTTFFGPGNIFSGTSAAAAHAAGVVALMKEYKPTLTPTEAEVALESSALDINADLNNGTANFGTGFDFRSGTGLIQADEAIDQILPVTLTSFQVLTEGSNLILNWETTHEINNQGFWIELRPTTSPTVGFDRQHFVSSLGEAGGQYQTSLTNLPPGSYALRLAQLDLDGTHTFSELQYAHILDHPSDPMLYWRTDGLQMRNATQTSTYYLILYNTWGQQVWEGNMYPNGSLSPLSQQIKLGFYRMIEQTESGTYHLYRGKLLQR